MATPTALASATSSPPTAGAFQDALGNVLKNGRLSFDLSQTAAIAGGGELAPTRVTITLDINGKVSVGQSIFRNTDLIPSGTTYQMQAFDGNGNFAGNWGAQIISGAAPIDLALLIPLSNSGVIVSFPAPVLLSPITTQTVNQPSGTSLNVNTFNNIRFALADGWACDGTTDDTSAMNSSITAILNAGGGTLVLPPNKTCKIAGQITIPNDGATPPKQKTLVIRGGGSGGIVQGNPYLGVCNGGSILDMTFNAANGKILTLGLGKLEITDICFKDSGTDSAAFVYTTNTNVYIHGNQFMGSTSGINDGIILGGLNAVNLPVDGTVNSYFQGYGTVIRDNQFDYVKRAVLLQNEANAVNIESNHIFDHSANATGGLIELNPGANPATQGIFAPIIRGNLLEMGGAKYGVNIVQNTVNAKIEDNSCFDSAGPATACVIEQPSAGNSGNIVIDLNPTGLIPSSVTNLSRMITAIPGGVTDVFARGSQASPSLQFNAGPAHPGWYQVGGTWAWAKSNVTDFIFDFDFAGQAMVPSTGVFAFASGTLGANSGDTGISRKTANVVGIGNGTAGDVSGEVRSAKISATYNAAGTVQTGVHIVQDVCTLGTNCGVTLAGAAAFTNATSYTCVCDDGTAISACRVNQTAGNAFTITGNATDVIRYICVGN